MLTIQTYKLLKDLKKLDKPVIASIDKINNEVSIYELKNASSIDLGYPYPPEDKKLINTYKFDEYKYLLEKHYIAIYTNPYISFTHLGYRIKQINAINLCWQLFFSVIIPFLVAYYTSK